MKKSILAVVLLLITFLLYGQAPQRSGVHKTAEANRMSVTQQELAFGGIGRINEHLYVAVKSTSNQKNELIVAPTEDTEERWHGKDTNTTEVAIFFNGKVWSVEQLPDGFDLSKAVVVSFEKDKIRYMDFQAMAGAYFNRIRE